jgi:hypothetical protein
MAGNEMDPNLPVENIQRLEQLKFSIDDEGNVIVRTSGKGTFVQSGLTIGGKIQKISINSTTWTAIPPAPLLDRNTVAIQNRSGGDILIQFDNATVDPDVSWLVTNGGSISYGITDSITVYAKSIAPTANIIIKELA